MEAFTVDYEKNTFPINDRCGYQADCLMLNQMMHLVIKSSCFGLCLSS
jgi:hypothetical protein